MNSFKNLYLFTGKGGVGKTTVALSFARFLKEQNQDVYFASIASTGFSKDKKPHHIDPSIIKNLDIKHLDLDLNHCAEEYVAKKLNSKIIAGWVVKTPFFKSLINMIPGFSYLIILGKILELIHKNNRNCIVVFDSPASGHTLTMLEATQNFNEIFQSGVIFDDTKKMLELLYDPSFLQVNIISILTDMSLTEGKELSSSIHNLKFENIVHIVNNAFINIKDLKTQPNLPDILKSKLEHEQKLIEEFAVENKQLMPHSTSPNIEQILKDLAPYVANLV